MCQFAGKTFNEGIKLGWFTAALESEGSIQLTWGHSRGHIQLIPRLNIANKSESFIERIKERYYELKKDTVYAKTKSSNFLMSK